MIRKTLTEYLCIEPQRMIDFPCFSDTIYSCTFIRKTNEEAGKVIAQILAVVIFVAMFILIVLEVWERHVITLGCGLLTLVLVFGLGMHSMGAVWETLNLGSFLQVISGIRRDSPRRLPAALTGRRSYS